MSPARKSAEVSHVESILEYACNSKKIDREAVMKLCTHVKADPQEQEVESALLNLITNTR